MNVHFIVKMRFDMQSVTKSYTIISVSKAYFVTIISVSRPTSLVFSSTYSVTG